MMVGDGINDAPSLASATIGVSVNSGTDIAGDSADVILMQDDLSKIVLLFNISKKTVRIIKQNLFWAFIYNIIMIPIAAGVFSNLGLYKMAPWMGSAAMALSSVFVVLNALRINLFNPYRVKIYKKRAKIPTIFENKDICESPLMEENKMEVTLKVEGMMCQHCVMHVKKALEGIDGVTAADVSLEKNEAKVTLSKPVENEIFKKAIEDAGYELVG